MPESRVVTRQDVEPHGLRCACACDCSRLLEPGDYMCERPNGMVGDIPMVLLVCLRCGEECPA